MYHNLWKLKFKEHHHNDIRFTECLFCAMQCAEYFLHTLSNSHYLHLGDDEFKVAEVIWLVKWQNLKVQIKAALGLTSDPKGYAINLYSCYRLYLKFSQVWRFDANAVGSEVDLIVTKGTPIPTLNERKI